MIRSVRLTAVLALCAGIAGCGGRAEAPPAKPPVIQVGQENIVRVQRDSIVIGPVVSGEVNAREQATVRAEIGGPVLQVTVDEGQAVTKGMLLGRIEATPQQDAQRSAESAVRSSENQLALARREAERTEQLVTGGALAARDLDQARTAVSQAEAQVADARARLVAAEKQAADGILRAPISGLIRQRSVNVGDVVSLGAEMFTIIDPSSMRLVASVPSDHLAALAVGTPVQFKVRGYDQTFAGRVERISPATDAATGQVPIYVSIPNSGGRLIAGLFAEGRVVTKSASGLVVPSNAVNTAGDSPWVLRANDGKAEKVSVELGLRDPQTERIQIVSGVTEGDVLLRGPAQGITPGTPIHVGSAGGGSHAQPETPQARTANDGHQ